MHRRVLALAVAAGWLLAACGGRDDVTPPRAVAAPPAAVAAAAPHASPPIARTETWPEAADHDEPIDVGALRLPQPEDTEPEPVSWAPR